MSEQIELWKEKPEDISVADLDQAVKALRMSKDQYAQTKKISDEAYGVVKDCESRLLTLMERAGKDKYICEGVGLVNITTGLSVKTPKTPEEKQAFFEWIRKNVGEDAYHAYMSVNSQTLNSFYNRTNQEYADEGKILEIDGLEQPTEYKKLSLRKA
jgi:hypothetical protein